MRNRLLSSSLLLVFVLVLAAVPAHAAPAGNPAATSTTTITTDGACSFTVTYTWSGFSGAGLVAEVAIGYRELGGANAVIAWTFTPANKAGSGGSASATFTLTGTPTRSHQFFGFGNLYKVAKNDPTNLTSLRNASAKSDYLPAQSCGSEITTS